MRHILLVLLLSVLAGAAFAAAPGPGPQIGTNLGFLQANEGEWPFVDVFKTSSGWFSSGLCGWDCGTLSLDADGWVTFLQPDQHAHALIFSMVPGKMPHGPGDVDTYVVLYDGIGVIEYGGSVSEVVSSSPGRDVVRVDPMSAESFSLSILKTAATFDPNLIVDPSEYIRNIRVIAPGGVCSDDPFQTCQADAECGGTCDSFEANYTTQIFHPQFLDNIRDYNVLRLMDWTQTTFNLAASYSEHPSTSSARWNRAPFTIMAELANRLDVDLWVSIPHNSDQSFLDGMAGDLVGRLNNTTKVYVEYSNEVWNPDFEAFSDVTLAGCDANSDLDCDNDLNPNNGVLCEGYQQPMAACGAVASFIYANFACIPQPAADCDTARIRQTVDRSIASWDAFTTAFEAKSPGSAATRLVKVLASRTGDPALHDALLSYRDVHQQVDAFATLGYFGWGLGGDPDLQNWEVNNPADMTTLFSRLEAELQDALNDMEADQQFLLTQGSHDYSSIPLVSYEGGQGLVVWGTNTDTQAALDHANELFDAANRDPRMGTLYQQLLDGWRLRGGGSLFNHYVNCRAFRPWARYGALEHQRQDPSTSPKYRALIDYIDYISGLP